MLKQKNEGPINLKQLNALMASCAEKRKGGRNHEDIEEQEENSDFEQDQDQDDSINRRCETEPSHMTDSNVRNIERNLAQLQGNIKKDKLVNQLIQNPKAKNPEAVQQKLLEKEKKSKSPKKTKKAQREKSTSPADGEEGKKVKKTKAKKNKGEDHMTRGTTTEEYPKIEQATQTSKKSKSRVNTDMSSQIAGSKNAIEGWQTNNHGEEDDFIARDQPEEEEETRKMARPQRDSFRSQGQESVSATQSKKSHKQQHTDGEEGAKSHASRQSKHESFEQRESQNHLNQSKTNKSQTQNEELNASKRSKVGSEKQSKVSRSNVDKEESQYQSQQKIGSEKQSKASRSNVDKEESQYQSQQKVGSRATTEQQNEDSHVQKSRKGSKAGSAVPSKSNIAEDNKLNQSQKSKALQSSKGSKANVDEEDRQSSKNHNNSKYSISQHPQENSKYGKIHSEKRSQGAPSKESSFDYQTEDDNKSQKSNAYGSNNQVGRSGTGKGKSSFYSNKEASIEQRGLPPKRRQEFEQNRTSEDEGSLSIQNSEHSRNGENMSFSAKGGDNNTKSSRHQAPQDEERILDGLDSQNSVKQLESERPRKRRADPSTFSVVNTEIIQIQPPSNTNRVPQNYTFSMGGVDQTFRATPTSSNGLKAMAEQIVRKFKAYDAQIKGTGNEYRVSVSPARSKSPSPDGKEDAYASKYQTEPKKKVFTSVQKSEAASSRKDSLTSQKQKGSIQGSLSSIHSGYGSVKRGEDSKKVGSVTGSVKSKGF